MKSLALAFLLLPVAAFAQTGPTQSNIDTEVGGITRLADNLGRQIAMDQAEIAGLRQQLQAATAERDKLKADTASKDATKP